MEHAWLEPAYADMRDNAALIDLYAANAGGSGRPLLDPPTTSVVVGSTDMGNVSHLVPSIHPMIAVAPPGVAIHTPEFAALRRLRGRRPAVLDGAKAMAMTVADLWLRRRRPRATRRAGVRRPPPEPSGAAR